MTGKIIIKGGRVVDESGARVADVAIDGPTVVAIESGMDTTGMRIIDAGGCYVGPGLVDIHTHLREPGREEAETVETGSRAAAMGGYTAVVAMPNTEPAIDSEAVVRQIQNAAASAMCDIAIAGSITIGRAGDQLSPMAALSKLGVRIFTDDGDGVQDSRLMLRALQYASTLDATLAQHCEDKALSAGGHMHEGDVSSKLGIASIPSEAEELMVMRDIALARKVGARMHFPHLSTAGSVAMIRAAKASGMPVTAEAAPHHFTLTDEAVASFDPVFKVNPPLRSAAHRDAVKAGLLDGTIDAIATDHAPHVPELKELPFDEAPCGMLGLETAMALALNELDLPIERLFALLSWQPAQIARLGDTHGQLVVGRPANITVVDPGAVWSVEPDKLSSKSRNSPYASRKLTGKVRHTIYHGEPVVINGEAQR